MFFFKIFLKAALLRKENVRKEGEAQKNGFILCSSGFAKDLVNSKQLDPGYTTMLQTSP